MSEHPPTTPNTTRTDNPSVTPSPECPEIGECPTSTVREPVPTGADRIHITDAARGRTRCGRDCTTEKATPMDPNAGVSDEWVLRRLGNTVDGRRMCPECARTYLGTEPGRVSWRHRLASISVYGRDTRHHLGGPLEVVRNV